MRANPSGKPTALEFEHPLKASLERWLLLEGRLSEVERALLLLIENFDSATKVGPEIEMLPDKSSLVRPLYCFAVVTYMRCFGGGRRAPLKIDEVPNISERNRKVHEDIRLLRNHHYAHAVSDEEGAHVLAIPLQPGIRAGFAVFEVVLAGPSEPDLKAFIALVRKIRRFVRVQEREVGNRLARATFGPTAKWVTCLRNGRLATRRNA